MDSADRYVKISKTGRLMILMANHVWLTYKFEELNLQDLSMYEKKKLCFRVHEKFKDKGFKHISDYTKNMVRDVLLEAIIEIYKEN